MQRIFQIFAFVLLIAALPLHAEDSPSPATTQSTNRLVGHWRFVSIGGKEIPHGLAVFWIIEEKHIEVTDGEGEQISRNAYAIDRSKDPEQLVMKIDGEKDRIGWFRFNDEELHLIFTINTGVPPESWDDGSILILRPAPHN